MAKQLQSNSALIYRQIMIEQHDKEQDGEMQEIMDDFMIYGDFTNSLTQPQGLKINEQSLFKYAPYVEPKSKECDSSWNTNRPQLVDRVNHRQILHKNTNHCLKTSKGLKHKVMLSGKRLKTQADKENIDQFFFPKMNSINKNKQSKLNKTTSALSFQQRYGSINITSNKFKRTNIDTNQKENNSQQEIKKSQRQESWRINSSLYGFNLMKTLKKIPSLPKYRLGNSQAGRQLNCQQTAIMTALTQITSKQDQLSEEKRQLEQRVRQLRLAIQRENNRLEVSKQKQLKLHHQRSRQSIQGKHSLDQAKVSKKKNANYLSEAKVLESKVRQVIQANEKVIQSIEEEKQLIIMYECVIEQVRGQLKLEKQAKQDLQKRLGILKKSMKSLETRKISQQASNKEIVRKIYASLQKWQ